MITKPNGDVFIPIGDAFSGQPIIKPHKSIKWTVLGWVIQRDSFGRHIAIHGVKQSNLKVGKI